MSARWTEAEDAVLRRFYPRLKHKRTSARTWAELLRRLPGRTRDGIRMRTDALGISVRRAWSPTEDATLRRLWSDTCVRTIRESLGGRSWHSIEARAIKLRLEGRWQGYVSLAAAADRLGYDARALLRIFEIEGVQAVVRAPKHSEAGQHRVVEWDAAQEAVQRWCAKETTRDASNRTGIPFKRLVPWLDAAGLMRREGTGFVNRLDPAAVDRVVAARLGDSQARRAA